MAQDSPRDTGEGGPSDIHNGEIVLWQYTGKLKFLRTMFQMLKTDRTNLLWQTIRVVSEFEREKTTRAGRPCECVICRIERGWFHSSANPHHTYRTLLIPATRTPSRLMDSSNTATLDPQLSFPELQRLGSWLLPSQSDLKEYFIFPAFLLTCRLPSPIPQSLAHIDTSVPPGSTLRYCCSSPSCPQCGLRTLG